MLPGGDLFWLPCLGCSKIELPQTAQPPQITQKDEKEKVMFLLGER